MCVPLVGHVAAVFVVCPENALLALMPVLIALLLSSLRVGGVCVSLTGGLTSPAQVSFLLGT